MPTLETDDPERSVPMALQKLFYKVSRVMRGRSAKDSSAAVAV